MLAESPPRQRLWPTLLWTGAGAVTFLLTQLLAVIVYVAGIRLSHPGQPLSTHGLLHNGRAIAVSTILSTAIVIVSFWIVTRIRTPAVASYLALRSPGWRQFGIGLVGFVMFMVGLAFLARQMESPSDMTFVRDFVSTARGGGGLALVIAALIVARPVGEELVFRGFLYRTLELRFGAVVAIVVTALGWAALHIQYSPTGMMVIFACGLFFGAMRRYSGSLYLTIVLHALWNGAALAGAMLTTSQF